MIDLLFPAAVGVPPILYNAAPVWSPDQRAVSTQSPANSMFSYPNL